MNKKCSKCKISYDISFFYKNGKRFGSIRYESRCKGCKSQYYKSEAYKASDKKRNSKDRMLRKKINNRSNESKAWRNNYHKIRINSDPIYKIKHGLRARLHSALKTITKSNNTLGLLGCSIKELRVHLESKFAEGMSWENYGLHGWHIDHIRPCASFNLSVHKDQEVCFHYSNLQPLWAADNLRKGDKFA